MKCDGRTPKATFPPLFTTLLMPFKGTDKNRLYGNLYFNSPHSKYAEPSGAAGRDIIQLAATDSVSWTLTD